MIPKKGRKNIKKWEERNEPLLKMELDIKGHLLVIITVYESKKKIIGDVTSLSQILAQEKLLSNDFITFDLDCVSLFIQTLVSLSN